MEELSTDRLVNGRVSAIDTSLDESYHDSESCILTCILREINRLCKFKRKEEIQCVCVLTRCKREENLMENNGFSPYVNKRNKEKIKEE